MFYKFIRSNLKDKEACADDMTGRAGEPIWAKI